MQPAALARRPAPHLAWLIRLAGRPIASSSGARFMAALRVRRADADSPRSSGSRSRVRGRRRRARRRPTSREISSAGRAASATGLGDCSCTQPTTRLTRFHRRFRLISRNLRRRRRPASVFRLPLAGRTPSRPRSNCARPPRRAPVALRSRFARFLQRHSINRPLPASWPLAERLTADLRPVCWRLFDGCGRWSTALCNLEPAFAVRLASRNSAAESSEKFEPVTADRDHNWITKERMQTERKHESRPKSHPFAFRVFRNAGLPRRPLPLD